MFFKKIDNVSMLKKITGMEIPDNISMLQGIAVTLAELIKISNKHKELEAKLDLIAQHLKVRFEVEPAKEAKLVIKK